MSGNPLKLDICLVLSKTQANDLQLGQLIALVWLSLLSDADKINAVLSNIRQTFSNTMFILPCDDDQVKFSFTLSCSFSGDQASLDSLIENACVSIQNSILSMGFDLSFLSVSQVSENK